MTDYGVVQRSTMEELAEQARRLSGSTDTMTPQEAVNTLSEVSLTGSTDTAKVEQIVKDYLEANPPEPGKDGEDGGYYVPVMIGTVLDRWVPSNNDMPVIQDGTDLKGQPGADGDDGGYYIPQMEGTVLTGWKPSNDNMLEIFQNVDLKGKDGKTPVKGTDYFTEDDIVQVAEQAAEMITIDQVDPSKVIFPDGLQTTYEFGKVKLTNGMATLVEPGGNLTDFFNALVDEKNPSTTQPSVSLTFSQTKAYEVGTKVTPSYTASLNPGSYTYGPPTGITAKTWSVKDTAGVTKTSASGSFAELQVIDDISYKITATASYDAGAIPVTNTGNEYAAGQIAAGSKSATSGAITGYRNTFYGTLTAKSDITSSVVRGLASKSNKALVNGNSFTVDVPVGALRVVIAYPATLRDVNSIKDVNGLNAEISSGFTKSTLNVEGANSYKAISYKIYTMDFANANDKANKFTVVI